MFTAVFLAGISPSGARYGWYCPPSALASQGFNISVCGVNQTRKETAMTKAMYFMYFVYLAPPSHLPIPHQR